MAEVTVKLDDQMANRVYDEAKRSYNGDVGSLMQDALNFYVTMLERFQGIKTSVVPQPDKEADPDLLVAKYLASEKGLTSGDVYALGERLTKIAKMYEDQKKQS